MRFLKCFDKVMQCRDDYKKKKKKLDNVCFFLYIGSVCMQRIMQKTIMYCLLCQMLSKDSIVFHLYSEKREVGSCIFVSFYLLSSKEVYFF